MRLSVEEETEGSTPSQAAISLLRSKQAYWDREKAQIYGPVAQLGERRSYKADVVRAIRTGTTNFNGSRK